MRTEDIEDGRDLGFTFKSVRAYLSSETETCYIAENSDIEYSKADFKVLAKEYLTDNDLDTSLTDMVANTCFNAITWEHPEVWFETLDVEIFETS